MGDRSCNPKQLYPGRFQWDIGYIVDVIDNSECVVDFDGQKIHYEQKDLDELVHAIASA